MGEIRVTVRCEPSLKEKVAIMAQVDRRTVSNQVAYLMEKGLLVLERQQVQVKAGKSA
jgi:predicted transcriptional regulator